MARDSALVELLVAGPFGGLDPTTPADDLDTAEFPAAANIVPNLNFGAMQTVQGRIQQTFNNTGGTPGQYGIFGNITGMTIFHRKDQEEVYIFATTPSGLPAFGQLVAVTPNGTVQQLRNGLTPNLPTYFAFADKWCFLTNGVDTPLKIDQHLNVTNWGIAAPTTAPTIVQDPAGGNLLGKYWYAATFGSADQESSQGLISSPIQIGNQQYTATLTIGGVPTNGDVVSFNFNVGGNVTRTASITVSGSPTTAQVAALLATQIITQYASQFASAVAVGNVITVTTNIGITAGSWWYLGGVTGGTTISPTLQTFFLGGTFGGQADLSNIPQPTDPQVTTINLYRIGGSLGQWRLIAALAPGTTTYTDNTADNAVLGQSLTIFRDPPPAFTFIASHQGRIFGFPASDPSTVWFSNYNEPWGFDPSANTRPVGENNFGDGGVAMASLGSLLVLFKRRSTYLLVGSTDADFDVIPGFPIGCTSANSVAVLDEGTVFWVSNQSVWAYNGAQRVNISDGARRKSNIKAIFDTLTPTDRSAACGFVYDHGYYVSFPTLGQTYLFDTISQTWWPLSFATALAVSDLEDPDHDPYVLGIGATGTAQDGSTPIHTWFAAANDLDAPLVAYVMTPVQNGGDLRSTKLYESLRLEAPIQEAGAKATVTVYVNPNSPQEQFDQQDVMLDGSTGGGYWVQQLSLKTMKGYNAQARIQLVATDTPLIVKSLTVYGRIDREMVELG